MLSLENTWLNISELFPILNDKIFDVECKEIKHLTIASQQLQQLGVLDIFDELFWLETCRFTRQEIVPNFWKNFYTNISGHDDVFIFKKCTTTINDLNRNFCILNQCTKQSSKLTKISSHSSKKDNEKLQQLLRESLICNIPAHLSIFFDTYHNISFKVFAKIYQNDHIDVDHEMKLFKETYCTGCSSEFQKCNCIDFLQRIYETNHQLQNMQLLDSIAGYDMTVVVQKLIEEHINCTCTGIFDRSHLKRLELWLENVILNWLTRIFNEGDFKLNDNKNKNVIQSFKIKLTYFLYETFARSIIDQFFSIIIDFPDSVPALDDLKICLEKIDIRQHMIANIKHTLENRILHPGVNTMDILTGYIAAIKAIRHLDSSGIILETVIEPIKEYLRKRSDTVRRVVTGLTEDGPTDLSEELAKGEVINANSISTVSDDLTLWENWMPEPLTFDFTYRNAFKRLDRSADIISMVIDIYGSKELFMNEYRNLMGDRLLTQLEFIPEKEIRNLELLKLRFGENLLHNCEVMLKDVSDSKRINSHIHADAAYKNSKKFEISSLILSAQFWPAFNKESLELPEEIEKEFTKFTKAYEAYKGNRTLQWRTVTGRVNIVIELAHRTIEMTVLPTQAVILYHFQNNSKWTLDELCSIMKVTSSTLKRRIHFWQIHGLIKEVDNNVYELIEDKTPRNKSLRDIQNMSSIEDDEIESVMASATDQREEELQVFWSYIVGMLTNLDCLPIERIHQMLKLFASQGIGIDFSQDELKDFLQRKVREHKLIFSAGVYQLTK